MDSLAVASALAGEGGGHTNATYMFSRPVYIGRFGGGLTDMSDDRLLELVETPREASRDRLSHDDARAVSREMVEAGFVDAHILQLMEVWGIPTATPDPEKMVEARNRTAKFLERVSVRITQEEEAFNPEVQLGDGD